MKFIALKAKDGESKGNTAFYCRILHVGRQGFYQHLVDKGRSWRYQPPADAMPGMLAGTNAMTPMEESACIRH